MQPKHQATHTIIPTHNASSSTPHLISIEPSSGKHSLFLTGQSNCKQPMLFHFTEVTAHIPAIRRPRHWSFCSLRWPKRATAYRLFPYQADSRSCYSGPLGNLSVYDRWPWGSPKPKSGENQNLNLTPNATHVRDDPSVPRLPLSQPSLLCCSSPDLWTC